MSDLVENTSGLDARVAAERLTRDGPNRLPAARPAPLWRRLGAQLFHFFAMLLWIAGALAIVAGMSSLGIAIFLVIVVNGMFAFLQEHRAERAAHHLETLVPQRAAARRDGSWVELDAADLVVGDVIALTAGDHVPADVRLSAGQGLLIDNSTLTGESVPVPVAVSEPAFAGTFVVEGEALARVEATGLRTRLAGIAELTYGRARLRTPLARELDRLVRVVAGVALAIGTAFFLTGFLAGLAPREGFLLAIGVAVALVPEGLLPTVTLSLAMGARRMAARGALVRRLEAVETLGSTTFICTDKTGTLTGNQMNAVEVWTPAGTGRIHGRGYEPRAELDLADGSRGAVERLALAAVRCGSGRVLQRGGRWVSRGDPMEAALHALSLRLGLESPLDDERRGATKTFAFDPHRRRMSVARGDVLYVKGAPDALLPRCDGDHGGAAAAAEMTERGLRVIAVGVRSLDSAARLGSADEIETGLELLGLVGLSDPPRPEARPALEACHRAGMRVAMVTGDHPGTACAIAREVGLRADLVVTGDELPEDEAMLGALLDRDGVVACRVSPEQKLYIAKALQARGHVVAMTGDGVNDGPALRQADIGIAMGHSGTDVARAAADLVLLDDQFETIVFAIEQGRATFTNLRRFLTYHLTDNVAELTPFAIWALTGGRLPLALGVLQILCLDLLTDQLPALALGVEAPSPHALERLPHGRHLVDPKLLVRAFAVLGPLEALVEIAAFVTVLLAFGWRPGAATPTGEALAVASGAAFATIVVGQVATAFACRSETRPAWRVPLRGNPYLPGALLLSSGIAASLLYLPPLARLLGHAPPMAAGLALAALAFPLVLIGDAAHKRWVRFRRASALRR